MSVSLTGAAYVQAITARASDRRARAAFQELVLEITPPGACIYDFGAGPGIDAWLYAECGFEVGAFDVDDAMCDSLAARCRAHLERRRLVLDRGSYEDFLDSTQLNAGRPAAVITANFAPLCLIEDLRPLFAKFHALTSADGQVLASVLSPCFVGDLRYGWWWRHAWRLWRTGRYAIAGAQARIIRRRLREFTAASAPYFTLEQIYATVGTARVAGAVTSGSVRERCLRALQCLSSRFIFLRFRKSGDAERSHHTGSAVERAAATARTRGAGTPSSRPDARRTI